MGQGEIKMIPSIPGLITIAGLFCTGFYLSGNEAYQDILETFVYYFLTFCSVNAATNLGVDREVYVLMYAVPAVIAASMTLYIFRRHPGSLVAIFISLYLFNIFGKWIDLDMYTITMGVDLLDISMWVQLGLLVYLAHKTPHGQRKLSDGRSHRVSP